MPDTYTGETPDQLRGRITKIREVLTRLDADIDLLWRRGQHPATDPYPSNLRAAEGRTGGTQDTPVERSALRGYPEADSDQDDTHRHTYPDTIGESIAIAFANLAELDGIAIEIEVRRYYVMTQIEKQHRRETALQECAVTIGLPVEKQHIVTGIGNDRLKAGYCPACYMALYRARQDDPNLAPLTFEYRRRDELGLPHPKRAVA